MKINPNKTAIENCPSFEKCNTNKCPLHKDYFRLENKPEDKLLIGWKRCRASKNVRMAVAHAFNMKWLGLTDKERDSMRKSIQMKKEFSERGEKTKESPKTSDKTEDNGVIGE